MAGDVEAILETLSLRDLKALATEYGVTITGARTKRDYVRRLAKAEAVRAALHEPPYRVRPRLMAKTVRELKTLAADWDIDVRGCRRKADFVDRIAGSPIAGDLLEPAPAAEVADARVDPIIDKARNVDVEFGLVEDVLDQARMRFEEKNFDRALDLSLEALMLVRGTVDGFERAAWAYAVLAAERLIEESGRVGRDVEGATALLRDAKVALVSGNLGANLDLLTRLQGATKGLYSREVQRLRSAVYAAQEALAHSRHLGADTGEAEEALHQAQLAMNRASHTEALSLVREAERRAAAATAKRVKEIEDMIPATERVLEDARHVGAEVGEASKLLEKARVALEREEFVLAGELVQRAERFALQSQHAQIQRAFELRVRQLERGKAIVRQLVPILDEAQSFGIDVESARRLVADARDILDQGDYVNGVMLAREADEGVRRLVPRLVEERAKHGIPKPTSGRCPMCGSPDVLLLDDGWARCSACTADWRWRAPSSLWERFRARLREPS